MKAWVARIMGRSVRDLAEEVDVALGKLAHAQGLQAAATEALRLADKDVAEAERAVAQARDALFDEHPHLRSEPKARPTIVNHTPAAPEGLDPTKFEIVEVDDDNDPRFTAGAVTVSPSDDEPLPPVVWGEHD